jgi:hypothetical protein
MCKFSLHSFSGEPPFGGFLFALIRFKTSASEFTDFASEQRAVQPALNF